MSNLDCQNFDASLPHNLNSGAFNAVTLHNTLSFRKSNVSSSVTKIVSYQK